MNEMLPTPNEIPEWFRLMRGNVTSKDVQALFSITNVILKNDIDTHRFPKPDDELRQKSPTISHGTSLLLWSKELVLAEIARRHHFNLIKSIVPYTRRGKGYVYEYATEKHLQQVWLEAKPKTSMFNNKQYWHEDKPNHYTTFNHVVPYTKAYMIVTVLSNNRLECKLCKNDAQSILISERQLVETTLKDKRNADR